MHVCHGKSSKQPTEGPDVVPLPSRAASGCQCTPGPARLAGLLWRSQNPRKWHQAERRRWQMTPGGSEAHPSRPGRQGLSRNAVMLGCKQQAMRHRPPGNAGHHTRLPAVRGMALLSLLSWVPTWQVSLPPSSTPAHSMPGCSCPPL